MSNLCLKYLRDILHSPPSMSNWGELHEVLYAMKDNEVGVAYVCDLLSRNKEGWRAVFTNTTDMHEPRHKMIQYRLMYALRPEGHIPGFVLDLKWTTLHDEYPRLATEAEHEEYVKNLGARLLPCPNVWVPYTLHHISGHTRRSTRPLATESLCTLASKYDLFMAMRVGDDYAAHAYITTYDIINSPYAPPWERAAIGLVMKYMKRQKAKKLEED